jgi:hypothetical protein
MSTPHQDYVRELYGPEAPGMADRRARHDPSAPPAPDPTPGVYEQGAPPLLGQDRQLPPIGEGS